MMLYAVFTGDIIGSRKSSQAKLAATMENLAGTARFLTEYTGQNTKFTRFRGDGWQMVLSPAFYLRAVALIHANLKADVNALSTRLGIGIGQITNMGGTDLNDGQGSAFEHSGHALDALKRVQSIMISADLDLYSTTEGRTEFLRGAVAWSDAATLPMFSFIARRWSKAQAEAVSIALTDDRQTQSTISAKLGISRQALNLRLTGAGYGPILTAIKLTETYFEERTCEPEAEDDE